MAVPVRNLDSFCQSLRALCGAWRSAGGGGPPEDVVQKQIRQLRGVDQEEFEGVITVLCVAQQIFRMPVPRHSHNPLAPRSACPVTTTVPGGVTLFRCPDPAYHDWLRRIAPDDDAAVLLLIGAGILNLACAHTGDELFPFLDAQEVPALVVPCVLALVEGEQQRHIAIQALVRLVRDLRHAKVSPATIFTIVTGFYY